MVTKLDVDDKKKVNIEKEWIEFTWMGCEEDASFTKNNINNIFIFPCLLMYHMLNGLTHGRDFMFASKK